MKLQFDNLSKNSLKFKNKVVLSAIVGRFFKRIGLILLLSKPCLADPIPVSPPPAHVMIAQLLAPVLTNYLWNYLVLGVAFTLIGVNVKSRKFPLFILILTLLGLIVDVAMVGIAMFIVKIGFVEWIIIVGLLLFALSFSLTKLLYKLPKQKCIVSGLAYAVASHPIIGITFIIPILGRFSLIPPL